MLGRAPGYPQFFGASPAPRRSPDVSPNRAEAREARPARPARADDDPPPRAARQLAKADPDAPKSPRPRRPNRPAAAKPRIPRPAVPLVPSPLAPLIAAKEQAARKRKKPIHELPLNTPKWFRDYDTDGDGQIALHEWKAHGHSLEDFHQADLNGDGFITMKELVRAGLFAPDKDQNLWTLIQHAKNGEFFYMEVTGTTQGEVYGTDTYAFASSIETAAVHAGVLRDGEKGWVKVTFRPGQRQYEGSERNGVTSRDHYYPWPRSYHLDKP
jgi:hypothetical protein